MTKHERISGVIASRLYPSEKPLLKHHQAMCDLLSRAVLNDIADYVYEKAEAGHIGLYVLAKQLRENNND